MRRALCFVAAAAMSGSSFFLMPAPASAGGLVGDFLNNFCNPCGTALDEANRSFRNNQSDASFYNQMTGGYWNGFQPAPAPAPQAPQGPVLGNWCATPVGAYIGPFNPVGTTCGAYTPHGFFYGTVVRM